MRLGLTTGLHLLWGSAALGAVLVQNDNACTVSPGGAAPAPGKTTKRDVGTKEVEWWEDIEDGPRPPPPETTPLHAPGTPGGLESFPRPEPGSREARHYDKARAAALGYDELPKTDRRRQRAHWARDAVEGLGNDVEGVGARSVEPHAVGVGNDIEPRQRGGGGQPDDTPVILDAFKRCGKDGSIVFTEGTYNIRQVMNTSGLSNVDISIYGKFVWSGDNIAYWLRSSFGVTYAGRSTAWLLSGTNISMRGHGKALFDGNGKIWIDQNQGKSNQNGRPISLTVWRAKNVYIDGITWRMAQFWHTFVAHSQNVTMTNLDMSTWGGSGGLSVNTDGVDTWNSRDIVISNWTVKCGDVSRYP